MANTKKVLSLITGAGVSLFVASAHASTCGGALIIDEPTSLTKIAKRCNVSVTALREANPSLSNAISSGAYVAIPTQRLHAAAQPTNTEETENSSNQISALTPPSQSKITRDGYTIRDARARWINEVRGTSGRQISNPAGLSYQKLSAFRIHNASVPSVPAPINQTKASDAPTKLVSYNGDVHRVNADGSKTKVSAAFGLPATTHNAPPNTPAESTIYMLNGIIVARENGCLVLADDSGEFWRLAFKGEAGDLMGKEIRTWGEPQKGKCGEGAPTMQVSHSITIDEWN